ncbi:MAG: FxLYD domain-containing protein [Candidatus Eremiobacterota bacterium]
MLKRSINVFILAVIIISTFTMAQSGDWVVYVNNKPFTGSVNVSKDVVMVSIQELAQMLDFGFSYNELTKCLKINDTVYGGTKSYNNGRLYVSLADVAGMLGARYSFDPRAGNASIQTFNVKMVPVATAAPVSATPTPVASKGDEVKVQGLRELTETELVGKEQFGVSTVGLTGSVQNTAKVTANNVVVTVFVKDGTGKLQETLTKDMGSLKSGETKNFELFFRDGSIFYDTNNPAIIYRGINWVYDNKVDFKLEQPSPTPETEPEQEPAGK